MNEKPTEVQMMGIYKVQYEVRKWLGFFSWEHKVNESVTGSEIHIQAEFNCPLRVYVNGEEYQKI